MVAADPNNAHECNSAATGRKNVGTMKSTIGIGVSFIFLCVLLPPVAPAQEYQNSTEHFEALKRAVKGDTKITWDKLPDWTGLWTRVATPLFKFDPAQPSVQQTTAQLTPEFARKHKEKLERVANGIEWDPISSCLPPGYPRWLTEPFLREFVLRPDQSLLINEMVNDIRRIYTDGREHTPEDEAYPLWNGDSIGFWDGDSLVVHTTQLMSGQYQRSQPDYTDQVETVERWRKTDDNTIEADVTIYDPPALIKPWHVVQRYSRVTTPGLRIRNWVCEENANNEVVQTKEGATEHVLPGPGAGPIMKHTPDK
jgi:hypothetical protein